MFGIYLVVLGLVWFIFLYNDIRRHLNSRKAVEAAIHQRRAADAGVDLKRRPPTISSSFSAAAAEKGMQWSRKAGASVPHYCFNQGRHSGSFYLKIGAAGLCKMRRAIILYEPLGARRIFFLGALRPELPE